MDKLLIITGQTATGKTKLALELANKYNGELISFDSRQAYKYLDIMTGKEKDSHIKTWMLDIYNPKEIITAFDYCQKAEQIIQDILSRGKLPIIVGGTVFYIKSFLHGVSDFVSVPDWNLRNEMEWKTVGELQDILKKTNEQSLLAMNNSDINNKRRLIRKIEIEKNGKMKMEDEKCEMASQRYNTLVIGLSREKEDLVELIKNRVGKRIKQGVFEEIENLLKMGYSFSDPGLNTIGYKQLKGFFDDNKSKVEVVESWENAEIDYARRQLVFLKKLKNCQIFNLSKLGNLENIYELVLKWQYAKS